MVRQTAHMLAINFCMGNMVDRQLPEYKWSHSDFKEPGYSPEHCPTLSWGLSHHTPCLSQRPSHPLGWVSKLAVPAQHSVFAPVQLAPHSAPQCPESRHEPIANTNQIPSKLLLALISRLLWQAWVTDVPHAEQEVGIFFCLHTFQIAKPVFYA